MTHRNGRLAGFALLLFSLLHAEAGAMPVGNPGPGNQEREAAAQQRERYAEKHLFGDWGGWRTDLWQQGIQAKILLTSDPYGNTTGGLATGFTVYSMVCADLFLDGEKLLGLPGGKFQVGFAANFGEQLSANVVGNTFPIQGSDAAPPGPRLTSLSYTQSFLNDQLSLRIGRLTIDSLYGEEFAGSYYARQFTSQAFNDIPFALFYNAPGSPGYPETTLGARVRYQPRSDFYVLAGVYNADPTVLLPNRHGLDFTLAGPAYGIAEIGWLRHQGPQARGLPGNIKLGAFRLGGTVSKFNSTATVGGRSGFYLVADQALSRLGRQDEGRQLGVFGSLVSADREVSPMPLFFMTGLVATGPFASRPKDVLALGLAYGGYSSSLCAEQQILAAFDPSIRPQVSELTVEFSHILQVMPGLTVQPGVQLLLHPGGGPVHPHGLRCRGECGVELLSPRRGERHQLFYASAQYRSALPWLGNNEG